MPSKIERDGRIGPDVDLDEVRLPTEVGEGFASLLDREDRVRTAAEWVTALREACYETVDRPPSEADLCTTDEGSHAFVDGDGSTAFACVLDPLVVPFLRGRPGAVRSETPLRGATVEIEVTADGVSYSHPDAVVSIGVAEDVERSGAMTSERVYRQVCGYVNAFEDREEYEEWASEVDAATTSVPVGTGVVIARALAANLFDAG